VLRLKTNFKTVKNINKKFIIFVLFICFVWNSRRYVFSDDVGSQNYKIKDLSVGSIGGENLSSSGGYRIMISIGDNANDDRFIGTSYKLGVGPLYNWMATAPSIKCFAASAGDSTVDCDDPDVKPDGMVEVCGEGGCFDRAHFELYNENNPSDTLYSVQITTDPDWSTWNYIDASTFLIESAESHDINDYITESSWESQNFNILGLTPGTTYYIRATALHGDFTESGPGPSKNATTAYPKITFDIDIAGTSGQNSETSAPYSIDIGEIGVGSVTTAPNLIWLDLGSNSLGGSFIHVKDRNSGLFSESKNYTIISANANLDTQPEGYGLVQYFSGQVYLGPLVVETDFGRGGNTVGGISTTARQIYNSSSNPIYKGRAGIYLKAKASVSAPASSDYSDEITFTSFGVF